MDISVVIPTYNRAQLAARTVRSVLASDDARLLAEVIVVDDQSTDESRDRLSRENLGPLGRVLSSTVKGRAGARNTGLRAARGDIVLFLDDDIRVHPGLIEAHLRAHAHSQEPIAVQGRILPDPEGQATIWGKYEDRRFEKIHSLASASPADAPYNCFLTGNVSMPRAALNEVGGFDEGFTGYGYEDHDLGRRLRQTGVRLVYAENALAYHWTEALALSGLCQKWHAAGRSAALLISKAPEAVAELDMETPFSIPPYWERPRQDSLAKQIAKKLFFTRSVAALLGMLSRVVDRPNDWRILPRVLYCWYGMGFREAARQLASSSGRPS